MFSLSARAAISLTLISSTGGAPIDSFSESGAQALEIYKNGDASGFVKSLQAPGRSECLGGKCRSCTTISSGGAIAKIPGAESMGLSDFSYDACFEFYSHADDFGFAVTIDGKEWANKVFKTSDDNEGCFCLPMGTIKACILLKDLHADEYEIKFCPTLTVTAFEGYDGSVYDGYISECANTLDAAVHGWMPMA